MRRSILSPVSVTDLQEISDYLRREAGPAIAKSVLAKIKAAVTFLGNTPGAGHSREDLTPRNAKFWPVYSYLIVYDPSTQLILMTKAIERSD